MREELLREIRILKQGASISYSSVTLPKTTACTCDPEVLTNTKVTDQKEVLLNQLRN